MRWGVRDEMTNEHMTTELCMTELRNCQVSSGWYIQLYPQTPDNLESSLNLHLQRLSMGPNFIYFGGQKYGYRPIPTDIITSELAKLREVRLNQIQRGQGFFLMKGDVNCILTEFQDIVMFVIFRVNYVEQKSRVFSDCLF